MNVKCEVKAKMGPNSLARGLKALKGHKPRPRTIQQASRRNPICLRASTSGVSYIADHGKVVCGCMFFGRNQNENRPEMKSLMKSIFVNCL